MLDISEQQKKWLEETIRLAIENVRSGNGGPFGAIIVKDDIVIAKGTNIVTSVNDPTAHAEIVAIRAACKTLGTFQLDNCELYSSCEPCPMCFGAINWARPMRVFYAGTRQDAAKAGFDDSLIYDELLRPNETKKIPFILIPLSNAQQPFEVWKNKEDKIRY